MVARAHDHPLTCRAVRRIWPFILGSASACALLEDARESAGPSTTAATNVCPTDVVEGIDVSAHQGVIDWSRVAGSGRAFAFIKATQGTYNTQATFDGHWRGAKAARVLRGAYHFFDPTKDGVEQARYFLAAIDAAGGLEPDDLPPMLDLECPSDAREADAAPTCLYPGASGWVPPEVLRERAYAWLDTVERAVGRKPVIYSYVSWFSRVTFTDARLADYPLFIASIAMCPSVPLPWTKPTFWQYSFTGTVSGIAAPAVDLDRFVGTDAELRAFISGHGDAGVSDVATIDTGVADTGAALVDASAQGALPRQPDLATPPEDGSSGCGMHARRTGPDDWAASWMLGLVGVVTSRARRRRRAANTNRRESVRRATL